MSDAREVIFNEIRDDYGMAHDAADAIIAALAKAGFVVVACPPGGRVVVDRTAKPCQTCGGRGLWNTNSDLQLATCQVCAGERVVEATTTYGLEELSIYQAYASLGKGPTGPDYVKYVYGDVMHPTYEDGGWQPAGYETPLFRSVALPEETPHA